MPKIQANEYILKINPYIPGKPIEEVQRELGLKNVIKMASNENPFGPSPVVIDAIKKVLGNINRYPDGNCFYLRKALSQNLNVKADDIIFGNGSDEIILLALRAFLKPQEEVIVCQPSFLMYCLSALSCNAKVIEIPLNNFEYDLEAVKQKVTAKTKIVFFSTPNNPTGTYISAGQLDNFLATVRDDLLIFIDEAYVDFVEANDYPDALSLLKKYKNIMVARTFSKAYGLAGLRIGYGLADRFLIDCMDRIRDPFNVNYIAQVAAQAALKDKVYLRQIKKLVSEGRNYFYSELKRMKLKFVKSQANFVLIELGRNANLTVEKLLMEGIIVRDMKEWGMPNFIRVTVGQVKENLEFINKLKIILKGG